MYYYIQYLSTRSLHYPALLVHKMDRQFPVTGKSFPCYLVKIPCYVDQGICSQRPGLLHKSCLKSAAQDPNFQNSLLFSLLAGNWTCETGSTATASATTQSYETQEVKAACLHCGSRSSAICTMSAVSSAYRETPELTVND